MKISTALVSLLSLRSIDAKRCHSSTDCKAKQCCAGVFPGAGHCQHYSRERELCHRVDWAFDTGVYRWTCPCASGLVCVAGTNMAGWQRRKGLCFKRRVPKTLPVDAEEKRRKRPVPVGGKDSKDNKDNKDGDDNKVDDKQEDGKKMNEKEDRPDEEDYEEEFWPNKGDYKKEDWSNEGDDEE